MKRTTIILTVISAFLSGVVQVASAQDYYDDLYYSPSQEAKKEAARKKAQEDALKAYQSRTDYAGAENYTGGAVKPLTMDVDAYNRRTSRPSAVQQQKETQPDFSYTRRIERYHNPDVVTSTGDTALIDYYYSTAAVPQQDINVYVINTIEPASYAWNYNPWGTWPYSSWYYPYGNPWYGPSWSLNWGFDPWFNVSWGWGNPWYGPSWGWGWTSPSWGWHPGWHPGHHHPGWHPGHYPSRPPRPNHGWASSSPGVSRPHRPASGSGSYTPRPSAGNSWDYERPGNAGRPGNMGRPGNSGVSTGSHTRPSTNQSGYSPSTNSQRGNGRYGSSSRGTSTRNSSSTQRSNSSSNRNSNSSYRNSGSSSSRNSGSSYRSSGGSSRGSGGGYRGGGGSGGRGRR